jgi:NAD(P)-dependent dehydrogenase (short-subunit alcohol dehydrogenase family)
VPESEVPCSNPFALDGMHIAIVGASSGIGAELAVVLSGFGASITLMARREDRLREVQARCAPGRPHQSLPVDVTDLKALEAAFSLARQGLGPLDGLVYASGISQLRPLGVIDGAHIDNLFAVNFKGGLMATRYALSKGALKPGGSIVWISSVAAHLAVGAGTAVYAASKSALEAAKRILAVELAPRRIRINAMAVGTVLTPIWAESNAAMGERIDERAAARHLLGTGTVADVAHAATFLLSPASRWITGTTLCVDGGFLCQNRG